MDKTRVALTAISCITVVLILFIYDAENAIRQFRKERKS